MTISAAKTSGAGAAPIVTEDGDHRVGLSSASRPCHYGHKLKVYVDMSQQKDSAMADTALMSGKTVVITGATGGIGKATAIGLAQMGAQVAITGRDPLRAEQAATDIRTESGNPAVAAFAADLSVQSQVRHLAGELLDRYPRIDVLINNVGGFWATRRVTIDGAEHTFAVNHLAPFLLTSLLLDRLKQSAPARVVTVSSINQAMGKINFDDLHGELKYSGQKAYDQSKLANVLFTYELARRLEGTGVTATVLHPGSARTAFACEDPSLMYRIVFPLARPFLKTAEQGAVTSIYLASCPELEGTTGQYFSNCQPKRTNKCSYDSELAARLWQVSAQLVGLTSVSS
jgi:NAD(P)-dependent dehydrogenase (short-subunit alcohol dehydrogenase family)